MRYLIVNADDFGLTAGVNRAVIEAHARGVVTSTTLMANMPAFDEAVQAAKAHPSLGVGLHFNITQGAPVADSSRVSSLLNDRGEFFETGTALLKQTLTGKLRVHEIEIELRAQIEKVLAAGLQLTHVDSHKHSHALPPIGGIIAEIIGEYGIRAVRLPRETWRIPRRNLSAKLIAQSMAALALAQLCRFGEATLRRTKVNTTDAFFGVTQTGFWSRQWLKELIATLPEGVSELMSHPGYNDGELARTKTRLRESRATEFALLTDPEIIEAVRKSDVQLISYAQLADVASHCGQG